VFLIKSLDFFTETTTQHCATIWSICILHSSALTQIMWGRQWT